MNTNFLSLLIALRHITKNKKMKAARGRLSILWTMTYRSKKSVTNCWMKIKLKISTQI